jgi:hypothetical protein
MDHLVRLDLHEDPFTCSGGLKDCRYGGSDPNLVAAPDDSEFGAQRHSWRESPERAERVVVRLRSRTAAWARVVTWSFSRMLWT